MAEKGDAGLIEETTERMNRQLMAVARLTGAGEKAANGAYFSAMQTPVATPAPTPTPTTTPATTVPKPIAPTSWAPVPTITMPPEDGLLGAANEVEVGTSGDRQAEDKNGNDEQARLRETLSRQYSENIQALMDELDKASEALKPALRYAIEVAQNAYAEALASLSS